MPVRRTACQTRNFQSHHDAHPTQPNLGHQVLESIAVGRCGPGQTQVFIDHDDLIGGPTQALRPPLQIVLTCRALAVLMHLPESRLAHVQIRHALQMPGSHFIGTVHATPLFPGKTTPYSPAVSSNPAARPVRNQPILPAHLAAAAAASAPSRLPAKPSFPATQIALTREHGENRDPRHPDADSHTPTPSRLLGPNSSLAEALHRFFFRRASARSMDRGLIETPKRFWITPVTSFSVGEAARHCSTKSRTSSVHL